MWAAKLSLTTTRQISLFLYLSGSISVVWLGSTGALANLKPFQNGIFAATSSKAVIPYEPVLTTQSLFTSKIITATTPFPFQTQYINDDNLEFGKLKTIKEGVAGSKTSKLKITYYQQKEFAKELQAEEIVAPTTKIMARGTKKIIQFLDTPHGKISYFSKLSVFATSYDKNCYGCNETTATGAKVGYGIVAVDPKVIPLGTRLYIPGYGIGVAADTGGAIKGNVIDLAFDNIKSGWWSSRYTDVYLLAE